ncbi:MBL fold metallo-hydrolase [Microbacterium gorillae]|uniref:MBL fold metallo-hydrolase n=1 Tax=Microbacterium gorillae TaxID=1231063 RepID=UPI00058F8909|nr:MBL fold metallo-hydrolase [Microbacterium gorillae]
MTTMRSSDGGGASRFSVAQCGACGVETDTPSGVCPICADERQYVPADTGQVWTRVADARGGAITLREREPGIWGLVPAGVTGIAQEAKLIVTPGGNVLVDVPAFIDDATVAAIRDLGGIAAIVPTHPHMFGVQSLYADAFEATVWVAEVDAGWLQRRPARLQLWTADVEIVPGVRATQTGGHFPGSAVVHTIGADGAGVLLAGDTIFATPDGGVTFLRSFPNRIPLSAAVVRRVAAHVTDRFAFERLYSNFQLRVPEHADAVVLRSADRYARWVSGEYDHLT